MMFRVCRLGYLTGTGLIHHFNRCMSKISLFYIGNKILDSKKHVNYNNIRYLSVLKSEKNRYYSSSEENFKKLDDDYYLMKSDSNNKETFLLGVTKDKFKDFKEIVFINFTDEKEVKRGEYLFSVEDSKTLFDFYSPLECEIDEVNPKFSKGVNEERLKELFDKPENEDNYLVRVKLRKD